MCPISKNAKRTKSLHPNTYSLLITNPSTSPLPTLLLPPFIWCKLLIPPPLPLDILNPPADSPPPQPPYGSDLLSG